MQGRLLKAINYFNLYSFCITNIASTTNTHKNTAQSTTTKTTTTCPRSQSSCKIMDEETLIKLWSAFYHDTFCISEWSVWHVWSPANLTQFHTPNSHSLTFIPFELLGLDIFGGDCTYITTRHPDDWHAQAYLSLVHPLFPQSLCYPIHPEPWEALFWKGEGQIFGPWSVLS